MLLNDALHPAPVCLPRARLAPSRAGWSLQTIPRLPTRLAARRQPSRKMLRSDFCNRPTATSTPTDDSIPEFASYDGGDPQTPGPAGSSRALRPSSSSAQILRRCHPLQDNPGGASLDGDPPASAEFTTLFGRLRSCYASGSRSRWRRPVLAGAAIGSPSERRRPATVFSTASRARDTTSDALCRARRGLGAEALRLPGARFAAIEVSSKTPT